MVYECQIPAIPDILRSGRRRCENPTKGKQVLLTGGTGGLGMGVTPAVLAQEAQVTIPYFVDSKVERLKGILSPADFAKIHFVSTDLSHEQAVEKLVNDMERVDVLIHLVGGFSMGKTHEYSYDSAYCQYIGNNHLTSNFVAGTA